MYCKHDTRADIESKRRMLSEKIEMKRNSANAAKRSSSMLPQQSSAMTNIIDDNLPFQNMFKDNGHATNDRYETDNANAVAGGAAVVAQEKRPTRPSNFNEVKSKPNSIAGDSEAA